MYDPLVGRCSFMHLLTHVSYALSWYAQPL